MDEYFLQFLWKFQKFSTNSIKLTSGKDLTVFSPGYQNHDAGPDFLEAKIKINELVWSGSVEIHYKSSDWYNHKHQNDPSYQNVILHAVWRLDKQVFDQAGKAIPTLEISKYAPENLEKEYKKYISQPNEILCSDYIPKVPSILISDFLDKAFVGRLEEKAKRIQSAYQSCGKDWEETSYRALARNYGFKTNGESFEQLAKSLPYKILKKHIDHSNQLEALIFGMGGFLDNPQDEYGKNLASEFHFLKKKYELKPVLSRFHWKFSKLRPANFPTVRLAQFIAMISQVKGLFSSLTQLQNTTEAIALIKRPLPDYWNKHYDFGRTAKLKQTIGEESVGNIIINSVVPLLTAYSKHVDDVQLLEKAESLLEGLKSERNQILKKWTEVGIQAKHARDSQALIFMYQSFCRQKRCLQCNIGISIIGK